MASGSERTNVIVRYFAAAADAAGREEESLAFDPPTVGALRDLLIGRYGEAMGRVLASGSFLVDGVATRDATRTVQARVDVLPPFAGG
ncbi:MoaD/ThiS family protein [Humibacter sp. RRB41]|uniref:MoaD/ThiS family protein n=1 Tax=Humibacter sp. RRB41 TaxID=2919946 RepID=UPI001FA995BE|nr:MoaD/ThiS family protein [Humibacter sp. RRB41]